jgi:hypothetical protein
MNFSMNLTRLALGALVLMPAHALAQATPPLSVCSGAVGSDHRKDGQAAGW